MRRGGPRARCLLRSRPARTRRQWPLLRRLPHARPSSFQLSPAAAEARFQALQKRRRRNPRADDPLFRPIDADDFRVNGEQANDFSNLRQNGLIRIIFTLPPNMRLIDPATNAPSAETTVDVWRMVPSVNGREAHRRGWAAIPGRAART